MMFSERADWTLCFLFLYSIVTEKLILTQIQQSAVTSRIFVFTLNPKQEVRPLRLSFKYTEAESGRGCQW